jgi:hypothetical protein
MLLFSFFAGILFLGQVLDFFEVDPAKGLSEDQVRRYLVPEQTSWFHLYNLKFKFSDRSLALKALRFLLL